jgi:hypothetical protein
MSASLLTHFPSGFPGGVSLRGMSVLSTHANKVFWVDSANGSNGNKGTVDRPFATLTYAVTRCAANRGDIIMVKPNHAETITGVAGIALDKAGVSVIGMGIGNQRPRFLMDGATTVTAAITADDVYLENMVFASGHSQVVACFTTTKKGSWFNAIEFENNTTNEDFLTCIKATSTTDNDSDHLRVTNCRWLTIDADDLEFIEINANLRGLVVTNNLVVSAGTASPLILVAAGKIVTGVDIGWNRLVNLNTAGELFFSNDGTTNTGIVHNNYVGHADVTGAHDVGYDSAGFRLFDNKSVSTHALQGVVVPAADVDL